MKTSNARNSAMQQCQVSSVITRYVYKRISSNDEWIFYETFKKTKCQKHSITAKIQTTMADITHHQMAPVEILQKDKLRNELRHNLNCKDYVKFCRLLIFFLINSRFRNKNNCSYKIQTGNSNLVNVYFPLSSLITFWMVFPSFSNF